MTGRGIYFLHKSEIAECGRGVASGRKEQEMERCLGGDMRQGVPESA